MGQGMEELENDSLFTQWRSAGLMALVRLHSNSEISDSKVSVERSEIQRPFKLHIHPF